jgi:uncharacterized protein DUF4124
MIRRILLVLCLVLAASDAAALYKWVDEKGVTQYTETPPPDRKATKVEIKSFPPAAVRTDDTTQGFKERERELRTKRVDKEQAEAADKQRVERDAANRRARCLNAQRALDMLQSRPVYRTNERGERVYLEDKERANEIENFRAQARESCDTR